MPHLQYSASVLDSASSASDSLAIALYPSGHHEYLCQRARKHPSALVSLPCISRLRDRHTQLLRSSDSRF